MPATAQKTRSITLANLRLDLKGSEETTKFRADVKWGEDFVGTAHNDGRGGATIVDVDPMGLGAITNAASETLVAMGEGDTFYSTHADCDGILANCVNALVEEQVLIHDAKKILRKIDIAGVMILESLDDTHGLRCWNARSYLGIYHGDEDNAALLATLCRNNGGTAYQLLTRGATVLSERVGVEMR